MKRNGIETRWRAVRGIDRPEQLRDRYWNGVEPDDKDERVERMARRWAFIKQWVPDESLIPDGFTLKGN